MSAPTATTEPGHVDQVYVWEWPVRLSHWMVVVSILVLAVTGIYIGNPFITVSGEATRHFVMGTMKSIHFIAAMVFIVAVFGRILWMFAGNPYARWHQFIPVTRKRWVGLWNTFLFYSFIRRETPAFVGHNPLAGAVYSVVFLLFLMMIGTGVAMIAVSASVDSPFRAFGFLASWFGGLQMARFLHHVGMWLILGFAAHHIWSAMLIGTVERSSLFDSIFTGNKVMTPHIAKRAQKHIEEDR
jgi:Ni/Fe-hydrogenase 1 B-type cytochrome subunit